MTVPEIVWLATLEVSAAVLIATVGASVSSVNTTGVLVPVLPAASVSWATMEWAPSPDSVTVVVHSPARAHGRGADLGGDAANGVEQRHGGADRGLRRR